MAAVVLARICPARRHFTAVRTSRDALRPGFPFPAGTLLLRHDFPYSTVLGVGIAFFPVALGARPCIIAAASARHGSRLVSAAVFLPDRHTGGQWACLGPAAVVECSFASIASSLWHRSLAWFAWSLAAHVMAEAAHRVEPFAILPPRPANDPARFLSGCDILWRAHDGCTNRLGSNHLQSIRVESAACRKNNVAASHAAYCSATAFTLEKTGNLACADTACVGAVLWANCDSAGCMDEPERLSAPACWLTSDF